MLKRAIINIAALLTAAAGMLMVNFAVSAATVDEVAEVARSYGYSEEQIQEGYNEYYTNPQDYPPERLDKVIDKLHEAGSQIITTGQQKPDAYTTTTTTASATTTTSGGQASAVVTTTAASGTSVGTVTVKTPSGATVERMSREEFIALSYDDKMAYISTFTPEEQQAIIDDLSPEEYRSMLKQIPTDQKLQVVGTLSEAAEGMGLNITVDEITDDSLVISTRNSSGELVNRSSAGITVEDTGYNRTPLFAAAGMLFLLALGMLFVIIRRSFTSAEIPGEKYEN